MAYKIACAMLVLSLGVSISRMIKEKTIFIEDATWTEAALSWIICVGSGLIIYFEA